MKLPSRALSKVASVAVFFSTLFTAHSALGTPIKVAFIGDQGVRSASQDVLSLIASEGADLLLIQGDLGYDDNTANTWEQHINDALGENFPVLTVIGNHENYEWPEYQRLIENRINRIDEFSCSGNTGVKAKCNYKNIEVVQVAPGIYEVPGVSADDGYAEFIDSSFSQNANLWKICTWHKPHDLMQTGTKAGPSDWGIYDSCLNAGAMVALAHYHAYSRTYLLSSFSSQTIVHKRNDMELQPGQSFAFVSGLGGRGIKEQSRSGDYFASIYTATQDAYPGALFCSFDTNTAHCYFKATNGAVPDQFTLSLTDNESDVDQPKKPFEPKVDTKGYVFSRSDKNEYRWIEQNSNNIWGSIWISEQCAASLGGATATGDWEELMDTAPGFDTVANPCTNTNSDIDSDGFVFSRTEKSEYRWIAEDSNGVLGSIWMNKDCVDKMGGVSRTGDWEALLDLAPGFDTIKAPC